MDTSQDPYDSYEYWDNTPSRESLENQLEEANEELQKAKEYIKQLEDKTVCAACQSGLAAFYDNDTERQKREAEVNKQSEQIFTLLRRTNNYRRKIIMQKKELRRLNEIVKTFNQGVRFGEHWYDHLKKVLGSRVHSCVEEKKRGYYPNMKITINKDGEEFLEAKDG